jgi:hypothetical protein
MSENILVEIRDLLIEIVSLLKNQNQSADCGVIEEKVKETEEDHFTDEKLLEYLKENSIDDSCILSVDEVIKNLDEKPVVILTFLEKLVDDDKIIINNSCITLLQNKEQAATISETVDQSDFSYLNNANPIELSVNKNLPMKEMLNTAKLSEISTELINSLADNDEAEQSSFQRLLRLTVKKLLLLKGLEYAAEIKLTRCSLPRSSFGNTVDDILNCIRFNIESYSQRGNKYISEEEVEAINKLEGGYLENVKKLVWNNLRDVVDDLKRNKFAFNKLSLVNKINYIVDDKLVLNRELFEEYDNLLEKALENATDKVSHEKSFRAFFLRRDSEILQKTYNFSSDHSDYMFGDDGELHLKSEITSNRKRNKKLRDVVLLSNALSKEEDVSKFIRENESIKTIALRDGKELSALTLEEYYSMYRNKIDFKFGNPDYGEPIREELIDGELNEFLKTKDNPKKIDELMLRSLILLNESEFKVLSEKLREQGVFFNQSLLDVFNFKSFDPKGVSATAPFYQKVLFDEIEAAKHIIYMTRLEKDPKMLGAKLAVFFEKSRRNVIPVFLAMGDIVGISCDNNIDYLGTLLENALPILKKSPLDLKLQMVRFLTGRLLIDEMPIKLKLGFYNKIIPFTIVDSLSKGAIGRVNEALNRLRAARKIDQASEVSITTSKDIEKNFDKLSETPKSSEAFLDFLDLEEKVGNVNPISAEEFYKIFPNETYLRLQSDTNLSNEEKQTIKRRYNELLNRTLTRSDDIRWGKACEGLFIEIKRTKNKAKREELLKKLMNLYNTFNFESVAVKKDADSKI